MVQNCPPVRIPQRARPLPTLPRNFQHQSLSGYATPQVEPDEDARAPDDLDHDSPWAEYLPDEEWDESRGGHHQEHIWYYNLRDNEWCALVHSTNHSSLIPSA